MERERGKMGGREGGRDNLQVGEKEKMGEGERGRGNRNDA